MNSKQTNETGSGGIQGIDALIFDMDGTLWDGVETYAQGFNDFFVAENYSRRLHRNDIAGYMGWEEDRFLAATLPELSCDERKEAYQRIIHFQYKRIETDGGILYEGVEHGLQQLSQNFPLFIVSNCPALTIDYFMKWAGIKHLITDAMAHGQNYKHKHENIRLLVEKHGLKHPVYVGDTDGDSRQSRLAELPFVFVDYGFGTTNNYDLRFSSFQQLTDYFTSLKSKVES